LPVPVVNPLARLRKRQRQLAKTDALDAKSPVRRADEPAVKRAARRGTRQPQALVTRRRELVEMLTAAQRA
jgi:hypothetical protein